MSRSPRAHCAAIVAALLFSACGGKATKPAPEPPAAIGSARITWRILSSSGDPQTCAELGVDSAVVSLGGKGVTVMCGQEQVALFDNLVAQRYPVIVQLLKLRTSVFREMRGNVEVQGGKEATLDVVFRSDPMTHTGSLSLRWTVNSQPAAIGCEAVGGAIVFIQDTGESIDHLNREVPCTAGETTFDGLRPGTYGVILSLKDADGTRIAANAVDRITVRDGQVTALPEISLAGATLPTARLLARWTVSGTTAARGCAAISADAVVITATPVDSSIAALTASVACTLGQVRIDPAPAASHPYRVALELYRDFFTPPPHFPTRLAFEIVPLVAFVRGQTATVSADLTPP